MLVPAMPPINGVYSTDHGNGTILLTINSLAPALVGSYTCTATNVRATEDGITTIFGPPPPPTLSNSNVEVEGSTVTISLSITDTNIVIITHYMLSVYT